jgi:hypothetical protein
VTVSSPPNRCIEFTSMSGLVEPPLLQLKLMNWVL